MYKRQGQGAQVAQWHQGAQGHQGHQGNQGQSGVGGGQGAQGAQGVAGAQGNNGFAGAQGSNGAQGAQGQSGNATTGAQGNQGYQGAAGAQGNQGNTGTTGTVFTSGTRMIFQQTSAPTGWTKVTSGVNNEALRVVTGSVGSGGSLGFTNVFNSTVTTSNGSVSNHTLTEAQIPSHYHFAFRSGNHGQHQNGSPMNSNNYPSSGSGRANLYEGYNIGASGDVLSLIHI